MKRYVVYRWRVTADVKAALEHEARRDGESVGRLLERIATEWLRARRGQVDSDDEQARLHRQASRIFGTIAGGQRDRSRTVPAAVRRRLTARRAS